MAGLILGLVSILCGSYLLINGVIGTTQFSASIFGNETKLTDAAPGTVLFIVGLFLVVVSRYSKIKLPTSEGGNFVGAPVSPQGESKFHEELEALINGACTLLKMRGDSISEELFSFISSILRHPKCCRDYSWITDALQGASCYEQFVVNALQTTYESDEYNHISDVCGALYGSCPKREEIKAILLKGFLDTKKSNRLRERFFWVFNYTFKQDSIKFYINDLSRFLEDNESNEEICSEIIDFMHVHMDDHDELAGVVTVANKYLETHSEVTSNIHSLTKKLLNIA